LNQEEIFLRGFSKIEICRVLALFWEIIQLDIQEDWW